MIPTKSWRQMYLKNRKVTECQADLNTYFTADILYGKRMDRMNLGVVSLVNGQVIVADPISNLDGETEPFFRKVPSGDYEVEASVIMPDRGDCARYAAVRVRVTDKQAVKFEEALLGDEDLTELNQGEFYGVEIDSGIACICDEVTREAYLNFLTEWCEVEGHEFETIYDDFFAPLFQENYAKNPKYQREDGDYLDWIIPGTPFHCVLFESGFGDGVYPVYYGYDEDGQVCQIVIQLIDLSSAYLGEEESE